MDDLRAKRFLIGGAVSLALLIVLAGVIVAISSQVVWVSMEAVPSARLFLLALFGLLFSILNTLLGLFLYLQERTGKTVVYLIWGWSILTNVILTLAMIFMSV